MSSMFNKICFLVQISSGPGRNASTSSWQKRKIAQKTNKILHRRTISTAVSAAGASTTAVAARAAAASVSRG